MAADVVWARCERGGLAVRDEGVDVPDVACSTSPSRARAAARAGGDGVGIAADFAFAVSSWEPVLSFIAEVLAQGCSPCIGLRCSKATTKFRHMKFLPRRATLVKPPYTAGMIARMP
jgi:hypothetical protein